MSVFTFLGSIFGPAAKLIDDVVTTDEERMILRNKLAEIESKVATKMFEVQSEMIAAQARIESAVQKHGNWFTRSIRPVGSAVCFGLIVAMATGLIAHNAELMYFCMAYLGIYNAGRSYEKAQILNRNKGL